MTFNFVTVFAKFAVNNWQSKLHLTWPPNECPNHCDQSLIARQLFPGCGTRYCFDKSVRLYVTLGIVSNKHIGKLFTPSGRNMTLVFLAYRRYKIPRWTHLARTLNTTEVGKFAIYDRHCRLSRNWYEIGHGYHRKLIGIHRLPIDQYQFHWPWVRGQNYPVDFRNYVQTV